MAALVPLNAQQHSAYVAVSRSRILPAGTIDGSKTPDLIPDVLAYRLVFAAFSEPAGASPAQLNRQRAKLSQLELNVRDSTCFLAPLADFHGQYHASCMNGNDGKEMV
jgi:hypothetical protein